MIVELTTDGLLGCRGTGPGCLMYPDAHASVFCPRKADEEVLVCNQPFTDVRFVDKQEYLTWKLMK